MPKNVHLTDYGLTCDCLYHTETVMKRKKVPSKFRHVKDCPLRSRETLLELPYVMEMLPTQFVYKDGSQNTQNPWCKVCNADATIGIRYTHFNGEYDLDAVPICNAHAGFTAVETTRTPRLRRKKLIRVPIEKKETKATITTVRKKSNAKKKTNQALSDELETANHLLKRVTQDRDSQKVRVQEAEVRGHLLDKLVYYVEELMEPIKHNASDGKGFQPQYCFTKARLSPVYNALQDYQMQVAAKQSYTGLCMDEYIAELQTEIFRLKEQVAGDDLVQQARMQFIEVIQELLPEFSTKMNDALADLNAAEIADILF